MMKKWKNWFFFMDGWVGGIVMASADEFPIKIIVLMIVVSIYAVLTFWYIAMELK